MSEADETAAAIGVAGLDAASAGAMLRAARQKRGLHIAALAASIKVSPRKLEALEADRYDELPNITFTRALAQTMCRALKIDAEPVLDKLPSAGDMSKLEHLGRGLNAPFREAPGSRDPGEFTLLRKPMFWVTLSVLAGALVLALLPERWMFWRAAAGPASAPASAAVAAPPASTAAPVAAPMPVAAASVLSETVHSAPLPVAGTDASAAAVSAGVLAVRTSAESWVEVQDNRGQMLLSRIVQPGETVGLDGALPLRLAIGNAAATQLVFRGQPVDLSAATRDNVARLQLP